MDAGAAADHGDTHDDGEIAFQDGVLASARSYPQLCELNIHIHIFIAIASGAGVTAAPRAGAAKYGSGA